MFTGCKHPDGRVKRRTYLHEIRPFRNNCEDMSQPVKEMLFKQQGCQCQDLAQPEDPLIASFPTLLHFVSFCCMSFPIAGYHSLLLHFVSYCCISFPKLLHFISFCCISFSSVAFHFLNCCILFPSVAFHFLLLHLVSVAIHFLLLHFISFCCISLPSVAVHFLTLLHNPAFHTNHLNKGLLILY